MLSLLRQLIGSPPVGSEWLEYVVVASLLLIIINSAVALISSIFRWVGGR